MPKTSSFKKVIHMDEKILTPNDRVGSVPIAGNKSDIIIKNVGTKNTPVPSRPEGLHKSMIGKPSVYDLKGNLLASEENLVVITGREYLAQVLSNVVGSKTPNDNPNNYTLYQITHFGVGSGGASDACPPTIEGPFDDDTDLGERAKIGNESLMEPIKYISGGTLKQIVYDGEIKIVSEEHTINVPVGGQKVVDAYTAIKYVMYLQPNEPTEKPFRFNEAGLFAIEYSYDTVTGQYTPTGKELLFARFTTLDKWLDTADGIMIEWYVLV